MKKPEAIVFSSLFLIIIFGVGIVNLLTPANTFSKFENRDLKQRPDLSIESVTSGSYFKNFESYYTDQFIERDNWIKLYTLSQLKSRKNLINDYYVTKDNWIMGNPQQRSDYDLAQVQQSIANIKDIAKEAKKQGKDLEYVSLPHKTIALDHLYSSSFSTKELIELNQEFLSELEKEGVNVLDLGNYFEKQFTEQERMSFYFKTDHHWNALGAFEGYQEVASTIFGEELKKSDVEFSKVANKYFLGSSNKQLYKLVDENEEVPLAQTKNNEHISYETYQNGEWIKKKKEQVISTGINKEEIEYGDVYTWDIPYWRSKNSKPAINKKVLIFKDSYHNPTAELFMSQFSEVEIVDLRNIKGISGEEIVKNSDADVVLIMYNNLNFQGELFDFKKVR